MEPSNGAKLAVEALVDKGVEVIFTLSGGHITPLYNFLETSGIKLFDTRHEQAAVFMAEAYGRLRRKPGVAMVTAGPGFTNALTAVQNAFLANSPLVLIAGCVSISCCEKLDLQDMRQLPAIEPMVKKALVCHSPERVYEFVDMAFRYAASGRPGPVYLELPVDVLNREADPDRVKRTNTLVASHPVDLEKAAAMVELIAQAKRPMVVAGGGAWYAGAEQRLTDFAEATGLPIFTAAMGRGTIPDTHELCFEASIGVRPGATLYAQSDTDLIIFLGTRLSLYYMFGEIFGADVKMIQVDIAPEEIGRNRSVDLGIVSDIGALVGECTRIVRERNLGPALKERFADWLAALKMAEAGAKATVSEMWNSDNVPIHPIRLAREINDFLDGEDDIVVADGGDTQIWMGMTRTVRRGGHYLDSGLYGCLGVGLPFANAAKFLNPDKRVCLMIGDGSTGFNFMEFETAIRKKLPIVVVINNDLGWGMIRHSQQIKLGRAIEEGTDLGDIPYHKLVEALGGKGLLVTRPEDIRPALAEAFASGRTTCINVMTDPSTISPGSIALANVGAYK